MDRIQYTSWPWAGRVRRAATRAAPRAAATANREKNTVPPSQLESLLADPAALCGMSYTQLHSIPRPELDSLQREGLVLRFTQQVDRIAMLQRLASRQAITRIDELDDVVPLLFEHTMYKSYPVSLLQRQRFDMLTGWFA